MFTTLAAGAARADVTELVALDGVTGRQIIVSMVEHRRAASWGEGSVLTVGGSPTTDRPAKSQPAALDTSGGREWFGEGAGQSCAADRARGSVVGGRDAGRG